MTDDRPRLGTPRFRRRTLALLIGVLLLLAGLVAWGALQLRGRSDDPQRLAAALGLNPGMTAAEIGAGDGSLSVEIARILGPSGRLYSTELDKDRLADIREAADRAGLKNVTVVEAGVDRTNLPEQCCDAIFMRAVYHHFTAPDAITRDLHRVLRPGGRLAIIDFKPPWWLTLFEGRPAGVRENRGGHGMPPEVLAREVMQADFALEQVTERWSGSYYLALFRRP